jgi:hypothetical protein
MARNAILGFLTVDEEMREWKRIVGSVPIDRSLLQIEFAVGEACVVGFFVFRRV